MKVGFLRVRRASSDQEVGFSSGIKDGCSEISETIVGQVTAWSGKKPMRNGLGSGIILRITIRRIHGTLSSGWMH